jgi:hypothetical protein
MVTSLEAGSKRKTQMNSTRSQSNANLPYHCTRLALRTYSYLDLDHIGCEHGVHGTGRSL